jgi:hypothetical protein
MKNFITVALLLFGAPNVTFAQDANSPGAAPRWFIDEIATLTAGSGRWIADNSEYKGEQEPYEAYGTEWTASFDGTTMSGRLFGLKDGKETANFWEFRQYWHPGRREAVVEQFGWGGTVGIGTAWPDGDQTKSDQTFFAPDGSVRRTGHISGFPDRDTHTTDSYDIEGDVWTARRSYTWHRTPEDAE